MAHPDLTWFCGCCGYKRVEGQAHTCPPEPQQTIEKLVDLLPRNAPSADVLAEIERLGVLLRTYRPDALEVDATTLRWLLAAYSQIEAARGLLAPYPRESR